MSFYFWGFVKVEVKMHTRSLCLSRVVDNSEIQRTNPVVLTALTESVTPSAFPSHRHPADRRDGQRDGQGAALCDTIRISLCNSSDCCSYLKQ